jgi:hypothetical protein
MAIRKGLTLYRIIVQKEAFLSGVRNALLPNTKWNMLEVLNNWWPISFTSNIPGNKTVGEVIIAISYKLVMRGYEKEEITPSKNFISNYYAAVKFNDEDFDETTKCLNKCDKYKNYYTMTINQLQKLFPIYSIEEAGMAVKKSTKSTTKNEVGSVTKTGNFLAGCKSPRLRLYIPKIMEQEMTDQEIVEFMHEAGYREVNKGFISSARRNLNESVYKWAPEVEKELQEIKGEETEPTRPDSKKKNKNERKGEPERPEPTRPNVKKKTATKKTEKKTAVKKPIAKKTVIKKTAVKKPIAKKTVIKKTAVKKPIAKKTVIKKTSKKK